jgi:glutamine synthetase
MTPAEVLNIAKENGAKVVDLRFMDYPGLWQHFTVPIGELEESSFEDGFGFDGSSIRGWQPINASDMLVVPDAATAKIDPFYKTPTLVVIGNIVDPITREPYSRDPRYIARKAEAYLKQTGIADASFWGPEAEFFIFDSVRYSSGADHAFYRIDSREAWWNSGKDLSTNLGAQIAPKAGYFPAPPADALQDIRSKMVLTLQAAGIDVEIHHHEVATAGQSEIDLRFDTLTRMADKIMIYKYIIKNVAKNHGKTVTFMPKPLFNDNGTGMHIHLSIWKDGVSNSIRIRANAPISSPILRALRRKLSA